MSKDQTLEIDDNVIAEVAAKAAESVKSGITVPTAEEVAELVTSKVLEATEKTIKKDVKENETKETRTLDKGIGSLPVEVRFAKALKGYAKGDRQAIAEYNEYSNKEWAKKSDYQNVTTAADGGALVPDPEFIAEVERLTDEYGVAARDATVRSTDRDSVTLLSGTNEVSFTATNEATAQNAQKLTYTSATAALKKYIATLVMTSELLEDSAVNIMQDAANEIARARAKLFDQLVFTDATYGLFSATAGDAYKTVSVGSAITDLDWAELIGAQYKVVSSARRGGKFYMHPTVWNSLRVQRYDGGGGAGTGNFFLAPNQSQTPNIDGIPVELVDILPGTGDITANEPFAVFGDLSRIMIHVKRQLTTDVFNAGVVKDAGGSDINLITQDSYAMRVTTRVVPQTRFDGAFVIIGTGTVS